MVTLTAESPLVTLTSPPVLLFASLPPVAATAITTFRMAAQLLCLTIWTFVLLILQRLWENAPLFLITQLVSARAAAGARVAANIDAAVKPIAVRASSFFIITPPLRARGPLGPEAFFVSF